MSQAPMLYLDGSGFEQSSTTCAANVPAGNKMIEMTKRIAAEREVAEERERKGEVCVRERKGGGGERMIAAMLIELVHHALYKWILWGANQYRLHCLLCQALS